MDNIKLVIESDNWGKLFVEEANILGLDINSVQLNSIRNYANELLKWNKVINLTSIVNPIEILVKHFLDSIVVVPFIKKKANILDIGSGAGFPGFPIKIVSPSFSVVMIESSRKKSSFLKHLIRTLKISDVYVINTRHEQIINLNRYKKAFDIVICRAFTKLDKFIEIAIPFLSKNGTIVALKGKLDVDNNYIDGVNINEKILLYNKIFSVNVHSYKLPILELFRHIVFIKQSK